MCAPLTSCVPFALSCTLDQCSCLDGMQCAVCLPPLLECTPGTTSLGQLCALRAAGEVRRPALVRSLRSFALPRVSIARCSFRLGAGCMQHMISSDDSQMKMDACCTRPSSPANFTAMSKEKLFNMLNLVLSRWSARGAAPPAAGCEATLPGWRLLAQVALCMSCLPCMS